MNRSLLLLLGGLVLTVAPPVPAADRMPPGQYEMVTTADGKTETDSVCQTPEMAKIANGDAKSGREECWRLLKTDQPCSLKIDQGRKPRETSLGCG